MEIGVNKINKKLRDFTEGLSFKYNVKLIRIHPTDRTKVYKTITSLPGLDQAIFSKNYIPINGKITANLKMISRILFDKERELRSAPWLTSEHPTEEEYIKKIQEQ